MVEPGRLKSPPITEAVFDIRVARGEAGTVEVLDAATASLAKEYPAKETGVNIETRFNLISGEPSRELERKELIGFRLRSTDGLRVVQFNVGGFSFSWLRAYPGWEVAFAEATRLWEIYRGAVRPNRVVRLAVRTINRFDLPLPIGDFANFLAAPPATPEDLPLAGFTTRVMIPNPDWPEMFAGVTQSMVEPLHPNVVSMILDVDAFTGRAFEPMSSEVLTAFAELRRFKNRMFFSSITEKTRRLFE